MAHGAIPKGSVTARGPPHTCDWYRGVSAHSQTSIMLLAMQTETLEYDYPLLNFGYTDGCLTFKAQTKPLLAHASGGHLSVPLYSIGT